VEVTSEQFSLLRLPYDPPGGGAYWTAFVKGEFAAISAIRKLLPLPPVEVGIWIGDDAASVEVGEGRYLLLAADTVVAGVHADLALTGVDDLGWKAVAASVSDLAAMGGDPGYALVTVAGPPDTDIGLLYEGISAAAESFGCPVVGGDLTNSADLVVTVAVTGWCTGSPVSRAGARPGDEIWVTGPLGGSAAGLRLRRGAPQGPRQGPPQGPPEGPQADARRRHARPLARLAAGRAARALGATAMIDVSDGLAADLNHVAEASGVGLSLDAVPVHPAATRDEALGGGEDFELVFCVPAGVDVPGAFAGLDTPIRVGRCTSEPAERILEGRPLPLAGWEHEWRTN
jgi:thiamine-monophosphate kinase